MKRTAERAISATQANREFSKLLRRVQQGKSYVVTSHGRPVARILPAEETAVASKESRDEFLERLRSQPVLNLPRIKREEMYDLD